MLVGAAIVGAGRQSSTTFHAGYVLIWKQPLEDTNKQTIVLQTQLVIMFKLWCERWGRYCSLGLH